MSASEGGKDEIEDYFQTFVDVFCNIVGVLVFIILFISLMISQTTVAVVAPRNVPRKAPPSAYLECDNQKTYFIDVAFIMEAIQQVNVKVSTLAPNLPPEELLFEADNAIHQAEFDTLSYSVDKSKIQLAIIEVRRKDVAHPVPIMDHLNPALVEKTKEFDAFMAALDKVKKENGYLYFIVRPKSLDYFNILRDKLQADGYLVGWELRQKEDTPIRISSSRSVKANK
ncbi:MAG: hypothetical protein SGI71_08890 [Verrucomicrobiota bacterium]|nr:hypothetical protein [Verrucomicrobiota bacterium]